ncbi:MAG: TetR/AcrR family transcriptional regulator [Spirochaetia bacterium]
MPPRNKFTKTEIIDAAFEIAEKEGFDGITARAVAEKLGSSVAPIYVNFETIDTLIAAVIERIQELSVEILRRQSGNTLFENIGRASLAFASEYPLLFRELVLKPNPYMRSFDETHEQLVEALQTDGEMASLEYKERKRLLLKMQIFQTGLQVMIANDQLPANMDRTEAEELLIETGEELLNSFCKHTKTGKEEEK